MQKIRESVDLPAAPKKAWAKLVDFPNFGDWLTTHRGFPDGPPEKLEPGVSFTESVKVMGVPNEVRWTVEEVDAPNRLVMSGEGPMGTRMESSFEVEKTKGGSRVSFTTDLKGKALLGVRKPLEAATRKNAAESLAKLRDTF